MPEERFYRDLIDDLDEGIIFLDADRKIRFWSKGVERLTGFSAAEVMEQGCVLHCMRFAGLDSSSGCEGKCNIHRTLKTGENMVEEIYFQHKEGHRVPIHLRIRPYQPDPSKPADGVVEVLRDNSQKANLISELEELRRMALIDPLTEIGNRRYGEMNIETHLEEVRRYAMTFGLLFMDIDNFKQLNDTYGHNAGDRVLRMVGQTLKYNLRSFDISVRWGGEEFVALVLNVSREQLADIAGKIRHLVETSTVKYGNTPLHVTLSIGGTLANAEDSPNVLVGRADRAMYESKKNGKNSVTLT